MKKVIVLLVPVLLFTGCYEYATNRKNLNKLNIGMTKGQVLKIMGDPHRREAENNTEWLLYPTEDENGWNEFGVYHRRPDSQWLTPLFFEDGKLKGWGNNYWTTKERKFDVKIDQTIEQK